MALSEGAISKCPRVNMIKCGDRLCVVRLSRKSYYEHHVYLSIEDSSTISKTGMGLYKGMNTRVLLQPLSTMCYVYHVDCGWDVRGPSQCRAMAALCSIDCNKLGHRSRMIDAIVLGPS